MVDLNYVTRLDQVWQVAAQGAQAAIFGYIAVMR
jgi:hypothetical protein